MTLSKPGLKILTSLGSAILISLMFFLITSIGYAEEVNTDLYKMCDRQSRLTADKLRSNSNGELTAQDMSMIRLGAIHACVETYKRMVNSPDLIRPDLSSEEAIVKNDTEESQIKNSTKKESIFDRLLSTEKKEDVNPMQKNHRTGGK